MLASGAVKIIDIGYAESQSLARLSASSRDAHILGDVEFVRYLVFRILHHSDLALSALLQAEPSLRASGSIEQVRGVLREIEAAKQKFAQLNGTQHQAPQTATRLNRVSVGGYDLSGEAATLLYSAATSNGSIAHLRYLGGEHIQAGGNKFIESGNPRSAAIWKSAIELLENYGLANQSASSNGADFYVITATGYDVADMLAASLRLEAFPP